MCYYNMNTQVKISSNEGGVFTSTNNRVTFTIPGNTGHYDLSEGYINLMCSVPIASEEELVSNPDGATSAAFPFNPADAEVVRNTANANGPGVYCPSPRYGTDSNAADPNYYPNSVLVKHVSMRSQTRGAIEHIKRNDILTGNLSQYSRGKDMDLSQDYNSLFRSTGGDCTEGSVFTDINKDGTILSRNLQRQPVMIPLTDMLNFCNVKQYNTSAYGDTKLQLELDLSRINMGQVMGQDKNLNLANGVDGFGADQGDQNLFQMTSLSATNGASMTELVVGYNQDGASNPVDSTGYRPFNRLEDVPFYVGQKLNVAGIFTAIGGNASRDGKVKTGKCIVVTRRIVEIKYNRGELAASAVGQAGDKIAAVGSVTLVLNRPIIDNVDAAGAFVDLNGVETLKNIIVRGAVCNFNTEPLQVDFAELVVTQLSPQNVQPDDGKPIQYTTFETEEFTQPQTTSLNRMFECPPNCNNLFIFNSGRGVGDAVGQVISQQQRFTNYRLRVDNEDTSDREIFLKSSDAGDDLSSFPDPLHVQKQIVSLRNSRRPVKNLGDRRALADYTGAYFAPKYPTDTLMIGQVLPLTPNPKQVQVNISSAVADIGRLTLFKEVVKSV